MAGRTVDFDEKKEVGGFNPERRDRPRHRQVGPAPTDDPRRKAAADLKEKIAGKANGRDTTEAGND